MPKRSAKVGASSKQQPLTVRSFSTVGELLKDQGKLNAALEMYSKALEHRENLLGEDHPETLDVCHGYAILLEAKRQFEQSEEMFLRCVEGRKKMLGPKHKDTCDGAFNMAELYRKLNRPQQAAELYELAYEGYKESLGKDHKNTKVSLQRWELMMTEEERQNCRCIPWPDHWPAWLPFRKQ